jgi:hypothetical protein
VEEGVSRYLHELDRSVKGLASDIMDEAERKYLTLQRDLTVLEMCKGLIGSPYVGFSEWIVEGDGLAAFGQFDKDHTGEVRGG